MAKTKQTIVFDVDDFCLTSPPNLLFKIKEHYPNFKVTLFTIPFDFQMITREIKEEKYKEWAELIKKESDWMEIALHGFAHLNNEMMCSYDDAKQIIESGEIMFKKFGIPFKKIFRAPFWQMSDEAVLALRDKGYVIAHHPNDTLPNDSHLKTYLYNHSAEEKWPDWPIIKTHGHMGNGVGNGLPEALQNVLKMPDNAEFKTISEYMELR